MSIGLSTQTNRLLALTTPLGKDVLLLTGFNGTEAISELFDFRLDVVADNIREVAFEKILGQKITFQMALPHKKIRHFNGIVSSIQEGHRDQAYTRYHLVIVPHVWLLTRRVQSRIFQHESVVSILKKVFAGFDVSYEQLKGPFHDRDYCVQYHESDFSFASRLMEAEGIYYFFKHTDGNHKMVLANQPTSHPDMPEQSTIVYDASRVGKRDEDRIREWRKVQQLRSGKFGVWDYCFEMPEKHLEAEKAIQDSVAVGSVTHKFKLAGNDKLEIFDFPGSYANHFDGINKHGSEQQADLQKIFEENKATAEVRMQQEALRGLVIEGKSAARQLVSGYKFSLQKHFNADGEYVVTRVQHAAAIASDYRSGEGEELAYSNQFNCIPLGLPFRPQQTAPSPIIPGTQTAVVVGPKGEKIFTDKYGRVKVQFNWDRHGEKNADSSCWVRVAQNWGSGRWGGMFVPHVGDEVIVSFEDGDPDQPIITGRVYNAKNMPPRELPKYKTSCIIQDHGGDYMVLEGEGDGRGVDIYSPVCNTQFSMGAAPAGGKDHHYPASPNLTLPFGGTIGPQNGFYLITDCYLMCKVGNEATFDIHNSTFWNIGASLYEHVGAHYEGQVDTYYKREVKGGNYTLNVTAGKYITVVSSDYEGTYGGKFTLTVNGGPTTINVTAGDYLFNITGNWKAEVSKDIHLHAVGKTKLVGDADNEEDWKAGKTKRTYGFSTSITGGINTSVDLGAKIGFVCPFNVSVIAGYDTKKVLGAKTETILGVEYKKCLYRYETQPKATTVTIDWKLKGAVAKIMNVLKCLG